MTKSNRAVVESAVVAIREQVVRAESSREKATSLILRQLRSGEKNLHEALATARRVRASAPLDLPTRNRLLTIVSAHLVRTSAHILAEMPSAARGAAQDAAESVLRFFTRAGKTVPALPGGFELYRAETAALAQRAAGAAVADLRRGVMSSVFKVTPGQDTVADLIEAAASGFSGQRWRLERLARTEASLSFNGAQLRAVTAVAPHLPGLRQRWTELIDDLTGAPMDNRVAADSIAMHGQAVPPGRLFVMPGGAAVPERFVGMQWPHPPNRPNDRAVMVPWMPGWGVPAWEWQGRRAPL